MSIASRIEQIEQHLKDDYDVLGLAGTKGTELPIGYTQVDYIESSGTQYIDTGYTPNINTEVIIEFKDTNKSDWENYFGSENFRFLRRASGSTAFRWQCITNADITNLSIDNKRKLKFNKNGIYDENGTLILSNLQTSLTSTKNMLLFLSWLGSSFDNFGIFMMYSFKIYDNGTLVRNFIPCYRNSDNEVGMYDLVNDVFYTNKGTGAFTYGSVVLNRNIQNLKPQWLDRLLYFLANGTDTLWNNWEKVTGTGETLSLNNTIQAKMDFVYKGNTYQYSTTGKNLISTNINDLEQGTILGNDGTNASSNNRVRNNRFFNFDYDEIQPNHVWLVPTGYKIAIRVYDQNKNFVGTPNYSGFLGDLPSAYVGLGIKYIKIVYAKTDDSNITPNDIANLEFMISKGNDTSYEPYTNGASPNPDYPQDIQVVSGDNTIKVEGKNLLQITNTSQTINGVEFRVNDDKSITINGTASANTNFTLLGNEGTATQVLLLKASTPYYNTTSMRLVYRLVSGGYGAINSGTITPNSDLSIRHVYLSITSGTTINNQTIYPQIIKGSTALPYEPYQSQSYPISLGNIELCKIGDYQDKIYKDNGKWYLNKQIGKVVLNGSESNWNVVASSNLYRAEKIFNILPYTDTSRHIGRFICSHFYPNTNNEIGVIFQYKSTVLFYAPSGITTVEQWKTWLGNNNTTLYYVLATPTTTEITDTTLISQLEAIKKSYDSQTSISQVNTDKPFILDVVALGELEI